jgi:uncharacterized protein
MHHFALNHLIYRFMRSPRAKVALGILIFYIASQVFWIVKLRQWKRRVVKSEFARRWLGLLGWAIYLLFYLYTFWSFRHLPSPTSLTPGTALFEGPFQWWMFGSSLGFAIYLVILAIGAAGRLGTWTVRRALSRSASPPATPEPPALAAPSRRRFLTQSATALGAIPFAGGAYGALYGRLDLKITHPRIALPHLPQSFDGFTILQLSDLHIGPFMTAGEIRKLVGISNRLRPDLVVLTGDFVTWDASTQYAVVDALAGLKAPFGVWGCLGNHEIYTHTQRSITRLFAQIGYRILRQENTLIRNQQDSINLIGVDFERIVHGRRDVAGHVQQYLQGVRRLMAPGGVNILLSHNPNTFDRAAELGIDLSISGHTHGGQIDIELAGIGISPALFYTKYVRGWFRKGNSQLYVNRGIGTIIVPMRIGAPPEITVYHLSGATA